MPPFGGSPSRIHVSSDGKQALFEIVVGFPSVLTIFKFREATVWIMDIDDSNLRQLADTSRPKVTTSDEPLVNQPVWSPDSQNVLMTENYKSGYHLVSGVDITARVNLPYINVKVHPSCYSDQGSDAQITHPQTELLLDNINKNNCKREVVTLLQSV